MCHKCHFLRVIGGYIFSPLRGLIQDMAKHPIIHRYDLRYHVLDLLFDISTENSQIALSSLFGMDIFFDINIYFRCFHFFQQAVNQRKCKSVVTGVPSFDWMQSSKDASVIASVVRWYYFTSCQCCLPPSLSIFCCHLKSHLFSLSYPAFWLFCQLYSACAVTPSFWTL